MKSEISEQSSRANARSQVGQVLHSQFGQIRLCSASGAGSSAGAIC